MALKIMKSMIAGFRTASKGDARRCLTEARVPSFNGEKADLKPPLRHFTCIFTSYLSSPR